MKIEVWSDVMCPFCYIGKRNYEKAITQFAEANRIELVWKSYQLDPSIPEQGINFTSAEYLAERKGMPLEQVKQMYGNVLATAKKAGLDYDLENSKPANSFKSHRIMKLAAEKGLSDQAEEAFFKAHFIDGKDLNEKADLLAISKEIGLTEEEMNTALTDSKYEQAVKADIVEASQLGVQGVPFFVFNRKYAISGAQAPEAFLQTIETAFNEWKEANPESSFKVSKGESCDIDGNCD